MMKNPSRKLSNAFVLIAVIRIHVDRIIQGVHIAASKIG